MPYALCIFLRAMNPDPIDTFTIRVYALIFRDRYHVLLSDEYIRDMKMTKFPGGGLHLGEGPVECLEREALEEFGQEVEIISHYYTTDHFQKALFFDHAQLISIYYKARFKRPPGFRISDTAFDFPQMVNGSQSFRWVDLRKYDKDNLTFPIDRLVYEQLQHEI